MALSGKAGQVTGANGATNVREWSLSEVVDPLDCTNFDSGGWREFVEGLQGATGSISVVGARPATGAASTVQLDVSTASGSVRLQGAAIINNVEASVAVDGLVEYNGELTVDGTLTVTTVP